MLAVQSVRIVALASMVLIVKNAMLVSIAYLLQTIPQRVLPAVLEHTSRRPERQAVFHAIPAGTKM